MVLQSSLTSLHHSLNPGTKIQRAANTFVATKTDLAAVHVKSRRVWLGVADPSSPTRLVDADAVAAFQAWQEILSSTSTVMSMRSPPVLPVTATADAMASSEMAGLGGLATLADGRTVWFQFRISLAEAREHWNWVGSDMQKHIAVWELLAQFALTYCIHWALPHTRGPISKARSFYFYKQIYSGMRNYSHRQWKIGYNFKMKRQIKIRRHGFIGELSDNNLTKFQPN